MSEPPALSRVYGSRARLALLVPSPNTVAETEFWRMAPTGVSVHTSRMPFFADQGGQPFAAMERDVPRVLAEAVTADPSIIAYGCTASSAVGDPDEKERKLSAQAGAYTVTAAASLLAALRQLNATRIALITPYSAAVNHKEIRFFTENGIEVLSDESVIVDQQQHQMKRMYSVPTETLVQRAVAHAADTRVEAIVLSCCDMPTLDAIPQIERRTNKPVISSTQALFWRALRGVGISDSVQDAGRLLA
jgi:maleate cis-trans isomerase